MQDHKETTTISLPLLGSSDLCPVSALKVMFQTIPASKNSPLFLVCRQGLLVPLADSVARKHLKSISTMLNISPHLTFHSFRRSATTWAFQNGVPLQEIMKHGTWSSQAVWRYIKSVPLLPLRFSVLSNIIFSFSLAFGTFFGIFYNFHGETIYNNTTFSY